jgi:hypothetical protein
METIYPLGSEANKLPGKILFIKDIISKTVRKNLDLFLVLEKDMFGSPFETINII